MIIYLALGVLVLLFVLWLLRAFVQADPAKLAQGARVLVMTVAATFALLLLVILVASGRLAFGLAELGGIAPIALGGWMQWRRHRAATAPPRGQVSEVETAYLRMRLDHDTATMSGTVRRGRFQGRQLRELGRPELVELWQTCCAEDSQGASLLEAYLDRLMPGWRENRGSGEGASRGSSGDAMTRDEAYAILGLAADASEAEIRDAYHRLMMKLHPDQGGSTYLAAQINRAREVLTRG